MKKILATCAVLVAVSGCTDATIGKLSAYGGSAKVECYSAEKLIYSGKSTGKVSSSESSDGYYFVDSKDGLLKEVSGNCIVTYNNYQEVQIKPHSGALFLSTPVGSVGA